MMIVKFYLVATWFMHLRFDSKLFGRMFHHWAHPGRRRVPGDVDGLRVLGLGMGALAATDALALPVPS